MTREEAITALESLERVQVARFAPSDVIIVRLAERFVSAEQSHNMRRLLQQIWPDNEIVVLQSGVTIEALRPEALQA